MLNVAHLKTIFKACRLAEIQIKLPFARRGEMVESRRGEMAFVFLFSLINARMVDCAVESSSATETRPELLKRDYKVIFLRHTFPHLQFSSRKFINLIILSVISFTYLAPPFRSCLVALFLDFFIFPSALAFVEVFLCYSTCEFIVSRYFTLWWGSKGLPNLNSNVGREAIEMPTKNLVEVIFCFSQMKISRLAAFVFREIC